MSPMSFVARGVAVLGLAGALLAPAQAGIFDDDEARKAILDLRARIQASDENAQSKLAERMGVPVGQALLFITRVGYLESGQPVEMTHSYCHSDYYDFVAEMRRV